MSGRRRRCRPRRIAWAPARRGRGMAARLVQGARRRLAVVPHVANAVRGSQLLLHVDRRAVGSTAGDATDGRRAAHVERRARLVSRRVANFRLDLMSSSNACARPPGRTVCADQAAAAAAEGVASEPNVAARPTCRRRRRPRTSASTERPRRRSTSRTALQSMRATSCALGGSAPARVQASAPAALA